MFSLDYRALIIVLGVLGFLYWFYPKSAKKPVLLISSLDSYSGRSKTFLERFFSVPRTLFLAALFSLFIALLDPHLVFQDTSSSDVPPNEGLALYLVLDRSGSMGKIIDQESKEGKWEAVTRFSRMQKAANLLIQALPQDLIGVMAFSRAVEVIAPLTLDHKLLENRISNIGIPKDPAMDGTSIGYAIYKTAHLIAASKAFSQKEEGPYKILSAFMIIITDGFQDPSLLDKGNRLRSMELEEAAAYAKDKNIKVYIVNIDPEFKREQFAPNRHQMERISLLTGGKLIIVDDLAELEKVLKAIPAEEINQIYPEGHLTYTTRFSFYPYIIGLGLLLFGLSTILGETVFRRAL